MPFKHKKLVTREQADAALARIEDGLTRALALTRASRAQGDVEGACEDIVGAVSELAGEFLAVHRFRGWSIAPCPVCEGMFDLVKHVDVTRPEAVRQALACLLDGGAHDGPDACGRVVALRTILAWVDMETKSSVIRKREKIRQAAVRAARHE